MGSQCARFGMNRVVAIPLSDEEQSNNPSRQFKMYELVFVLLRVRALTVFARALYGSIQKQTLRNVFHVHTRVRVRVPCCASLLLVGFADYSFSFFDLFKGHSLLTNNDSKRHSCSSMTAREITLSTWTLFSHTKATTLLICSGKHTVCVSKRRRGMQKKGEEEQRGKEKEDGRRRRTFGKPPTDCFFCLDVNLNEEKQHDWSQKKLYVRYQWQQTSDTDWFVGWAVFWFFHFLLAVTSLIYIVVDMQLRVDNSNNTNNSNNKDW